MGPHNVRYLTLHDHRALTDLIAGPCRRFPLHVSIDLYDEKGGLLDHRSATCWETDGMCETKTDRKRWPFRRNLAIHKRRRKKRHFYFFVFYCFEEDPATTERRMRQRNAAFSSEKKRKKEERNIPGMCTTPAPPTTGLIFLYNNIAERKKKKE